VIPLEAVACRRIRGAGVSTGRIEVKSVVGRVKSFSVEVGLSTGIQMRSVGSRVKSLSVGLGLSVTV
jgi:hypothetical protein